MNKELYYTPTIEEFHVGFECEIRNSSGNIFDWEHFQIVGVDDAKISGRLMDWSFYDSKNAIEEEQVRVKYLDQSDIESLGWKLTNQDCKCWYEIGKLVKDVNEMWHPLGNWKYRISVGESNRIHIDGRNSLNGGQRIMFNGTIKNKSELKLLMQQLEINE